MFKKKIFVISFVVNLYLLLYLFVVYLIYCRLEFDIDLIVVIYFIVDIFWSCPIVFPSSSKGFPRNIWYSFVDVFSIDAC